MTLFQHFTRYVIPVLLLSFCSFIGNLHAQELITDRPDQTESSSTVPQRSLQWEHGFSLEKSTFETSPGAEEAYVYGYNLSGILLRYGLLNRMELRVGTDVSKEQTHIGSETVSGSTAMEPMYAGVKVQITQESGLLPELAILGHLAIPALSTENEQKGLVPDITLAGAWTLSSRAGLGFNLGFRWDDFKDNAADLFYSLVVGLGHTDKLSSFWEIYGYAYSMESMDARLDAGITYLIKDNLQWDASAGVGLSEISPKYFISTGVSLRIGGE